MERHIREDGKLTRDLFNLSTDDDDTDDETKTPMPVLDGSSDSDSLSEGKEEEPLSKDTRLSLIATPVDERARWEHHNGQILPYGSRTAAWGVAVRVPLTGLSLRVPLTGAFFKMKVVS